MKPRDHIRDFSPDPVHRLACTCHCNGIVFPLDRLLKALFALRGALEHGLSLALEPNQQLLE